MTSTVMTKGGKPKDLVPVILDREIEGVGDDAFGHRHFAEVLRSLVEDNCHKPPYSIGLLGAWGTGKSSIKSIYSSELENDETRKKRLKTITFNAWRYGGENIRRALLRDVFLALGGSDEQFHEKFFEQLQTKYRAPRNIREILRELLYERILWTLWQFGLMAVLVMLATWLAERWLGPQNPTVTLSVFGLLAALGAKFFLDPNRFFTARYRDVTKIELPCASAEEYEKVLQDQLVSFQQEHRQYERMVVFVDDLDRLSSEEMVAGLDAIRNLMEMRSEKCDLGMVFVISCDEERVAEALSKRAGNGRSEMPGAIGTQADARRFLDRLFQFRLEVPRLPRVDMRAFAVAKLSSDTHSEVRQTIEAAGSSVEEVVSRMIHVGVQSPRNTIQILNAFTQSMWIAMKREFEGAEASHCGALATGTVTSHPVTLAVLSVLKVDFPDFYKHLQCEPRLIGGFIETFVNDKPDTDLSATVRRILAQYTDKGHTNGDDSKLILAEQYYRLRQYLASVATVEFPGTLQPFLLLNQDPVARRTSDGGEKIYEPMVSGDLQGTLRVLGRDHDDRDLTSAEAQLVSDVWEIIEQDSEDRQTNASYVIVSLLPRVGEADKNGLCRRLVKIVCSSEALRNRLGVARLLMLAKSLHVNDKRKIAAALTADWIRKPGEAVPCKSVDQAQQQVRQAVDGLLSLAREDAVDKVDKESLFEWLNERSVTVAGEQSPVTEKVPFDALEEWVGKYEDVLLPAIGVEYVKEGVVLLDDEQGHPNESSFISRAISVLDGLASAGDERFAEYWDLLVAFCGLYHDDGRKLGRAHISGALSSADDDQVARLATAIADKLKEFPEEGDPTPTDQERADVTLLVALSKTRASAIHRVGGKICTVCFALSTVPEAAEEACLLASALVGASPPSLVRIEDAWGKRFASDLPAPCARWLGQQVGNLPAGAAQDTLVSSLSESLQNQIRCGNNSYNSFWDGVNPDRGSANVISIHVRQLHATVIASPITYSALFAGKERGVALALSLSEPAKVQATLSSAVQQAKAVPESFAALYGMLKHWWPSDMAPFEPFSASAALQRGVEFLSSVTPASRPHFDMVIDSLARLAKNTGLSETEIDSFLQRLVALWADHAKSATPPLAEFDSKTVLCAIPQLADKLVDDDKKLALLSSIMKHQATAFQGDGDVLVVSRGLAQLPPKGADGKNDAVLETWFASLADSDRLGCIELLADNSLNDDQRVRVWEQLLPAVNKSTVDWCARFIVRTLDIPGSSERADSAFSQTASVHQSATDLWDLALRLVGQFSALRRSESKRKVASWIKKLNGGGAVDDAIRSGQICEIGDLDVLQDSGLKSSTLTKQLKKLRKSMDPH